MRRKASILIVVAAIAGTACSGGSSNASKPAPDSAVTSTTFRGTPADRALAHRIGLTLADLPKGWTQKPRRTVPDDGAQVIRRCLHIPGPKVVNTAVDADSPDFASPDRVSYVSSHIAVAQTQQQAAHALDVVSGSKVPQCLAAALDVQYRHVSEVRPDTRVGRVSVRRESLPGTGERTVAYQVEVPVESQGQHVNVYIDFIVVQRGRVGIFLTESDEFAPAAIETSQALLRKMLARV